MILKYLIIITKKSSYTVQYCSSATFGQGLLLWTLLCLDSFVKIQQKDCAYGCHR